MKREKYLDLVIAGPDMSGTTTQIKDTINYFKNHGMVVKDLRGTEIDALFHAEKFSEINKFYSGISDLPQDIQKDFLLNVYNLMSGGGTNQDLQIASMIKNNVTTYINPNSADVWIMEEPTKRNAGQINRVLEQNRSQFNSKTNHIAAALSHQAYRSDEFFRFRKPLRDNNKIIVRSRSEESACYQLYDPKFSPKGMKMNDYLNLPGHGIAFRNSPTNIFIVCGPLNWTTKDYLKLKEQRNNGRSIDDYESDAPYQVMVNKRYASGWLENLYGRATKMNGGKVPKITRFNIYDSMEEIKEKMQNKLESLL